MPDVEIMLWTDFESTGLLVDPDVPTLLENAWTVTDTAGRQVVPLRHRFTILPAARTEDDDDRWRAVAPLYYDKPSIGWYSELSEMAETPLTGYPVDAVREMHWSNGLMHEFAEFAERMRPTSATAAASHDKGVIVDWDELDRLYLADVEHAGAQRLERGQLCLAGGGVSHYEDRFLRYCAPRTFGLDAMHYSAGSDVSTVLRALSIRLTGMRAVVPDVGKADKVLGYAREAMAHPHLWPALPENWARIELSDAPLWDSADRDVTSWIYAEQDSHRAAPGIVRALLAYRLLPWMMRVVAQNAYVAEDLAAAPAS